MCRELLGDGRSCVDGNELAQSLASYWLLTPPGSSFFLSEVTMLLDGVS